MNIRYLMNSSKADLLSIYCTAGYPELNSLPIIISACEQAGVDFMEIGIPYSDPLCDGPTIQESSAQALTNGMNLNLLFQQLSSLETSMPLVLMGYFNIVLQYGVEQFCQSCQTCGVEAVILPDLPIDIYEDRYLSIFEKYDLHLIFLVTPQTSKHRIRQIDDMSVSFIYAVSSSTTTGASEGIFGAKEYLKRLEELKLKHPFVVGFNIANAEDYKFATRFGRGAIIGSAFIKKIGKSDDLNHAISNYILSLKPPE